MFSVLIYGNNTMNRLIFVLTILTGSTYSLADSTLNTTQEEAILIDVPSSEGKSLKQFSLKYLEATLGELAFTKLTAFLHEAGHAAAYKYATGFLPHSLTIEGNAGHTSHLQMIRPGAGVSFAGPFLGLLSTTILESMVLSSFYGKASHISPLYWVYLSKEAKTLNLLQLLPRKGLDGEHIAKYLPWISNLLKIGSLTADGYVEFSFYRSLIEKISPELGNSIIDYAPLFFHLSGIFKYLAQSSLPHMLARLSGPLYGAFVAYSIGALLYKVYTNLAEDAFEKLKDRISLASAFDLAYDLGPYILAAITVAALNDSKLLDFTITWSPFDRSASFFSGVISKP